MDDILISAMCTYLKHEEARNRHGITKYEKAKKLAICTKNDIWFWLNYSDDELNIYFIKHCS